MQVSKIAGVQHIKCNHFEQYYKGNKMLQICRNEDTVTKTLVDTETLEVIKQVIKKAKKALCI